MSLSETRQETEGESPVTEAPLPVNSSFSRIIPALQLAWDSTSYNALDKCPRFYEYNIVRGFGSPYTNSHLEFGILLHSSFEFYDKLRAGSSGRDFYRRMRTMGFAKAVARKAVTDGLDFDEAMLGTLRFALVATWNFKLNRPWLSDEPTKTRNTLLRTIVWYLDKFKDDPLQTIRLANGRPAVELSFRFSLNELDENGTFVASTGEELLLCGHIDRGVEFNLSAAVTDKKTTKYELDQNYFKQYSPNSQVSIYTIAGIVVLKTSIEALIIDGIQLLVNGSRFRRQPVTHTTAILEEWLMDFRIRFTEAERYAKNNYWPMNRQSCGYGNNQCTFRQVCSAEPSMRDEILKTHYIKRQWDPLQPR